MIQYVAFLRGINFGGRKIIDMKELKRIFESLGLLDVSTLMNSGNVIFCSNMEYAYISKSIEKLILERFGFEVKVLIITHEHLISIHGSIPIHWESEKGKRPHIAFLWKEIDTPDILESISIDPEKHPAKYVPGALVWNVELRTWSKDKVYQYLNSKVSEQVTIRSINTVKKLIERIKK